MARRTRLSLPCRVLAYVVVAGCSDSSPETFRPRATSSPKGVTAQFGRNDEREFDFGHVIGGAGRTLVHNYQIVNRSDRPIKLVRAVNGKPCCGQIEEFQPGMLDPGQSTTLRVKVKTEQLGSISHRALVETNADGTPVLEFWTLANAHPRVRMIEAGDPKQAETVRTHFLIGEEVPRKLSLSSLGTTLEPPEDLDSVEIACNLPARWTGAARLEPLTNGLQERRRDFSLLVKAGDPGQHSIEVKFTKHAVVVETTTVTWTTQPLIKASPPGLILSSNQTNQAYRILVTSSNKTRFTIKQVRATLPDVEVSAERNAGDQSYSLSVRRHHTVNTKTSRTGEIVVETDSPQQPLLKVGLYLPTGGVHDRTAEE
jgi:hypothetical protein